MKSGRCLLYVLPLWLLLVNSLQWPITYAQPLGSDSIEEETAGNTDEDSSSQQVGEDEKKLPEKNKPKKTRLLIGEADFSYAVALIKKHPGVCKQEIITATAYEKLNDNPHDDTSTNLKILSEHQVEVLHGVDATKLAEDNRFSNKKFDRITFNFPHDKSNYEDRTLPELISSFFKNASQLQNDGGVISMALPEPPYEEGVGNRPFYHGYIYEIYDACQGAGYGLEKKRGFIKNGNKRYEGYEHRVTGKNQSAGVTQNSREYHFVKNNKKNHEVKSRWMQGEDRKYYARISTDDESSEYGSSEEVSDELVPTQDDNWYTDDHINRLLRYYLDATVLTGARQLVAINLNADDGEVLSANLRDQQRLLADAAEELNHLLIPINIGNCDPSRLVAGQHWVALYLDFNNRDFPRVTYFDPLGGDAPEALIKIIKELYPNITDITSDKKVYQRDSFNCGLWVIEFFRHLLAGGKANHLPMDLDVDEIRPEHLEALNGY